jgi:uncharacterized protein VirK/YbjX
LRFAISIWKITIHSIRKETVLVLLFAALIHQQTQKLSRAIKFVVRSLFTWPVTIQWLDFIQATESLAAASNDVRAVLGEKIHRPFARHRLKADERARILIEHYKALATTFPSKTLFSLVSGCRLPLAEIEGKRSEDRYVITISREMPYQHQGELAIAFSNESLHEPLATLAINIIKSRNGRPGHSPDDATGDISILLNH